MRNNLLSGSLPSELGQLHLSWLIMSGNRLSGSIPTELSNYPNLEELWLQENQLSGPLPSDLHQLMSNNSLTVFNISGNTLLKGRVPDELCAVSALSFDCSETLCGCDCSCIAQ